MAACCSMAVAELRGERGEVRRWWEGGEATTNLPLSEVREAVEVARRSGKEGEVLELVVAMACGRVLRIAP